MIEILPPHGLPGAGRPEEPVVGHRSIEGKGGDSSICRSLQTSAKWHTTRGPSRSTVELLLQRQKRLEREALLSALLWAFWVNQLCVAEELVRAAVHND
jgi:hypothetical protein